METHGFGESSYDAASFATMMGAANPDFMVAGPADWRPFPLANSTRVAFVEPGKGVACGVLGSDPNSALLSFAANSGSVNRFDYIIARFNWAIGDVVLMVLPGGTTPPAVNTTQSVNSAQVNRIPGVMYDGIIAVVRVRPGVTQFNADDVTDKRDWPGRDTPVLVPPATNFASPTSEPYGQATARMMPWGEVRFSGMIRRTLVTNATANRGAVFQFTDPLPTMLRPGGPRTAGVASTDSGPCTIYYTPNNFSLSFGFHENTTVYTSTNWFISLDNLSYFL